VLAARTPSCPGQHLVGGQSNTRIVYAELDVKSWRAHLPSAGEVRPASCPCCGTPSRPAGGRLVIHGHGVRTRDEWGPPDATAPPEVGEVVCRRYHCLACGAVLLVVPCGILRRRLYSAGAIALALALWGVEGLAPGEARARVSPWRIVGNTAAVGWASLRRWARAVRDRTLFAYVRASPAGARLRAIGARVATTLAAYAASAVEAMALASRAFLGSAHVT
jgi:hypothetical protein